MCDELAYRLGFLIGAIDGYRAPEEAIRGWHQLRVSQTELLVHPDCSVLSVQTSRGNRAVAIGDIFVAHGDSELEDALLAIADGDRAILTDLSGRFALVIIAGGEVSVIHDPLGSQSVFYASGGGVAASHSALVAETMGLKQSRQVRRYMALPEYKARTTRFLPGDLSIFDGVHLLAPNNELHLRSGRTSRYWPSSAVQPTTPSEAFSVWDEYFSNYAAFLAPRYRPVIGLTGGTDSRAVIATLRSKGIEPRCETWDRMPQAERDRISPMVSHLGVQHDWLDLARRPQTERFDDIRAAAKKAAGYTRGVPVLPALMDELAQPRDIFIYGHGSGVMRGSYSRTFKPWLPEDPLKRFYVLYAGTGRKVASSEYETFTLEALRGFLERANFQEDLHDADIGDLFYWEQRMANWAAMQISTFAVTIQSHAALNSRKLFTSFWGIEGELRSAKHLNMEIMRHYDSSLAEL